jgi:hypothetical protein
VVPGQLTIDEELIALNERSYDSLGSMERLGETFEFGYMLLELLSVSGWQVNITKPFAGMDETGENRAEVLVHRYSWPARGEAHRRERRPRRAELFGEAMRLQGRVLAA